MDAETLFRKMEKEEESGWMEADELFEFLSDKRREWNVTEIIMQKCLAKWTQLVPRVVPRNADRKN